MSTVSTTDSALAAPRRLLGLIALVLAVGEVVSAFLITFPAGAVVFACLLTAAALWVRRGGIGGPLLVAALCAFEVADFPSGSATRRPQPWPRAPSPRSHSRGSWSRSP